MACHSRDSFNEHDCVKDFGLGVFRERESEEKE